MESDIYSQILSQDDWIVELDNEIDKFLTALEEDGMRSAFAGNSFDESVIFGLPQYTGFTNNCQSQPVDYDISLLNQPYIFPSTLDFSVEQESV